MMRTINGQVSRRQKMAIMPLRGNGLVGMKANEEK